MRKDVSNLLKSTDGQAKDEVLLKIGAALERGDKNILGPYSNYFAFTGGIFNPPC